MHPQATPTRLPRWGTRRRLRCSSLKYSRYCHPTAQTTRGGGPRSRSSRLAGGAPRPSRCDARLSPRAARPVNPTDESFARWLAALEKRHLAELTFSEVSRALRALSSTYVERRHALAEGAALSGAGKRAAFALFYGPLHFLLIRHISQHLSGGIGEAAQGIDLGCRT